MTKSLDEEWREYKVKRLLKQTKYKKSQFPEDFNVFYQKKLILDEELLKLIWIIKKRNTNLKSEKQVVREALHFYVNEYK